MTGNHQLDSLIAAILIGGSFAALLAVGIFIYRILFTKNQDEYPVKYYGKAKSKRTGGKDIKLDMPNQDRENRSDGPNYNSIINDYPTYHRQGVVK